MKRFSQLCGLILTWIVILFSQVVHAQGTMPEVTLRLVPVSVEPTDDDKKVYQLNNDMDVTVYVDNKSKQRLRWNVLDPHYIIRFQLFKDDVLIPYREEITNLERSKEEKVQGILIERERFIEPETFQALETVGMYDWYGPLAPGIYRVIMQQRFEIGGPWTRESVPMFFEIPEIKNKNPITPAPDAPKLTRKPRPRTQN